MTFAAPAAQGTNLAERPPVASWAARDGYSLVLMLGETERRERFAYALQQALKRQGVSERALAKALGVDPRRIASFRTGKVLPDLYETMAIARELKVKEELFRDPPPVPAPPAYPIEDYLLGAVDRGAERGQSDEPPPAGDEPGPSGRTRRPRPRGPS